ncbi:AAA family ATPase [Bacillus wiedmannii]|uniref:AAA family ATPase n=1 Tax=Bacillus wiedmannii TaxID=1890302 RepID=UPI0035DAA0E1
MKIQNITIEAFRGFNEKVTFDLHDSQVLVLYGPNGHGKTSVFDAIEWSLTGEINRYNEASDERNRTRFIRNLSATENQKTYVSLSIITKEKKKINLTRYSTANLDARSDYGESELELSMNNCKITGDDAIEKLNSLLIKEAWRDKVDSPVDALSLTHILGQEKLNQFLRGMKEGERYQAISILFGTEQFIKYRDKFIDIKKILEKKLQHKSGQLLEAKKTEKEYLDLIDGLKKKLEEEDNDFNSSVINEYIELLSNGKELVEKSEWKKIHKLIKENQEVLLKQRYELENKSERLISITKDLSNWENEKKQVKNNEKELRFLEEKILVVSKRNKVKSLKERYELYSKELVEKNKLKEKEKELSIIINKLSEESNQLEEIFLFLKEKFPNANQTKKLDEIIFYVSQLKVGDKEKITLLLESLNNLKEMYMLYNQSKKVVNRNSDTVKGFEKSISKIYDYNKKYSNLLNIIEEFVNEVPTLNHCPTCGTEGITSIDILDYVKAEQGLIHPDLPELEVNLANAKGNLKKQEENLYGIEKRVGDLNTSINEFINEYENKIKKNGQLISDNHKIKSRLIGDIDLIDKFLLKYKEDAAEFQLDTASSSYYEQVNSLLNQFDKKLTELSKEDQENLAFKIEEITKNIRKRKEYIREFIRDLKIVGIEADFKFSKEKIEQEINQLKKLQTMEYKELGYKENLSLRALHMVESNDIELQILSIEGQLKEHKNRLEITENDLDIIKRDLIIIEDVIKNVPTAMDNLNEKLIAELFNTIQKIYSRINLHPIYKKLNFFKGKRYGSYKLLLHALTGETESVKANPSYIFSSAQVNSVALSFFMSMALKQQWSSLDVLAMDDPIQSLDEVNIIALIDLLRVFLENYDKQIIISTHDYTFFQTLINKLRFHRLAIIEYDSYGIKGPSIVKQNIEDKLIGNSNEKNFAYDGYNDTQIIENELVNNNDKEYINRNEYNNVQIIEPLNDNTLDLELMKLDC